MARTDIISQLQSQIDEISGKPAERTDGFPDKRGRNRTATVSVQAAEFDPADERAAFRKIVDLVNASDKSEATIRQRLLQKGYDETAIDASVERAKEYGFIDDMRYAEVLVRSRISQGKGSAGIERELKSLNIDPFSLESWNEAFGSDDSAELDRALDILKKKPPRSKNPREAAFRKLVNKGYPVSVAASAARMWTEEQTLREM